MRFYSDLRNGMRGIDVFSGAGGMSVGALDAGIISTVAIENDQAAASTYALNHPNTKVLCQDIRTVDFKTFRSNEKTILFGGPPCQGFSTSNQRTRNSDNKNNWLFREFLRAAEELAPDWIVLENVKGLAETENAKFFNFITNGIEQLGYSIRSRILNASEFGVPQSRSRQFVIAANCMRRFSFPPCFQTNKVTVREAISDLPELENGASVDIRRYNSRSRSAYSKMLRNGLKEVSSNLVTRNSDKVLQRYTHIPEGGNWADIPRELMNNYKDPTRCHTGIYKRLAWNDIAVTIGNYRKNMLIHPSQNRGLSVREAARLQSFPDSYLFSGSIGFQQQQVGNAVPPLMAKAIFEQINEVESLDSQYTAAAE